MTAPSLPFHPAPRELTPPLREQILALFAAGHSYKVVAETLTITIYSVRKVLTEAGVRRAVTTKQRQTNTSRKVNARKQAISEFYSATPAPQEPPPRVYTTCPLCGATPCQTPTSCGPRARALRQHSH